MSGLKEIRPPQGFLVLNGNGVALVVSMFTSNQSYRFINVSVEELIIRSLQDSIRHIRAESRVLVNAKLVIIHVFYHAIRVPVHPAQLSSPGQVVSAIETSRLEALTCVVVSYLQNFTVAEGFAKSPSNVVNTHVHCLVTKDSARNVIKSWEVSLVTVGLLIDL